MIIAIIYCVLLNSKRSDHVRKAVLVADVFNRGIPCPAYIGQRLRKGQSVRAGTKYSKIIIVHPLRSCP